MQQIVQKKTLLQKLSEGAKIEVIFSPGDPLKLIVDDEVQEAAREVLMVSTNRGVSEVKLRMLVKEGEISRWEDYIIPDAVIYMTARRESDGGS